jgi:hypothetical protein
VTVIELTAAGAGSAGTVVVVVDGPVVVVVGADVEGEVEGEVEEGAVVVVVLLLVGAPVVDDVGLGSSTVSASAPTGARPSVPATEIAITTAIRPTVRARSMRFPQPGLGRRKCDVSETVSYGAIPQGARSIPSDWSRVISPSGFIDWLGQW